MLIFALPVTVLNAVDFTKAGITTLGDLLQALPQALSLLPSNAGAGTIINLRGLGSNRTLVLLNGRRLSNEPTSDGLANIDILPISALERVEVLNDGASSIYGSDAVAGVVNFITKRQYQGIEITAQDGKPQHSGGGNEQAKAGAQGADHPIRVAGRDARALWPVAQILTDLGAKPSTGKRIGIKTG